MPNQPLGQRISANLMSKRLTVDFFLGCNAVFFHAVPNRDPRDPYNFCALDEVGVCTHWWLVAGDLLMYLGLAHTVTGFFSPLGVAIDTIAANLSAGTSEVVVLRAALSVAGGAAWFLATYAGPVVSLLRSPFSRRINIALAVVYLVLFLALCWVNSQAVSVEAAGPLDEPGLIIRVLRELIQPLRW